MTTRTVEACGGQRRNPHLRTRRASVGGVKVEGRSVDAQTVGGEGGRLEVEGCAGREGACQFHHVGVNGGVA